MIVETKCKFCHKPLTLTCEDTCNLEEPYKSMVMNFAKMVACDRCAEYKMELRSLFWRFKKLCFSIMCGVNKERRAEVNEALTSMVKKYMRMVSEHRGIPLPDFDPGIVEDMMTKPGNYELILKQVSRSMRQQQLV